MGVQKIVLNIPLTPSQLIKILSTNGRIKQQNGKKVRTKGKWSKTVQNSNIVVSMNRGIVL